MQINHPRRNQGNFIVGILIIVVAAIILVKLWCLCNKLFPAPPKPGTTGSTNNTSTNGGQDEAVIMWISEPSPGNNLPPSPNYQFVIWGEIPIAAPAWRQTNGSGYLQIVNPNSGMGLDYVSLSNVMQSEYGIPLDPTGQYSSAGSYSSSPNPVNGIWYGGIQNQPYVGYITVPALAASDEWRVMCLQRSTNGIDYTNVATNWMKCGEFEAYLDLGGDKMAFFRTIQPPGQGIVPVISGPVAVH